MTPHEKLVTVRKLVGGNVFRNPTGDLSEWDFADGQTPPTEEEVEAEFNAQEYARNRKEEYDALNQFELISDDSNNGTTTHIDAVNAIKTKYPKP